MRAAHLACGWLSICARRHLERAVRLAGPRGLCLRGLHRSGGATCVATDVVHGAVSHVDHGLAQTRVRWGAPCIGVCIGREHGTGLDCGAVYARAGARR